MAGDGTAALVVALSAQLTKFEKDMGKATGVADRSAKQIEDRFNKINPGANFLKNFAIGALGAISLERLVSAAKAAVADLAKIGDEADRIGVTAEQLQELRFAVEQSGGAADDVAPALTRFANNLAKALDEDNKLARFLAENNVALKDRNGVLRPTVELLGEVANLIQNARTPQERLNIAVEFFGRQAGPAMVTALANGAAGLRVLGAQAQQAGTVLDNELIKKAQVIDDRWQQVSRTFSTTLKGAIIEALDAMKKFSDQANIAAALDKGTESAKQLREAFALARSKGSPIDPGWIARLERLDELDRESNRFKGASVAGSTLPPIDNRGRPTKTSGLREKDGSDSKDKFEAAIAAAQKRIAVQEAETAAIDLGAAAIARARMAAELETAAKLANAEAGKKNTEVTAEQRAKINELADAYGRAAVKAEEANGPLRSFAREGRDTNKLLQDAAVGGMKSFEDGLISIVTGAATAKDAFKTMANSIISDLLRIAIRQSITGPLAGALGGAFGGGNAFLPGPSLLGGNPTGLAGGTDNWRGGPTWVGERGPEIVNLPRGTQVVPNDVARKSAGGGGVTVSPVIHVDATGADAASIMRLERALAGVAGSIKTVALQAVSEHSRRYG